MPDGPDENEVTVVQATGQDPLASLSRAGLWIPLGDSDFFLPYVSARVWLTTLYGNGSIYRIIPGFLHEADQIHVENMLEDLDLDLEEIKVAALDAITLCAGRDWWFVVKLLAVVRASWDRVNGHMVLAGVDPDRVSLGEWLDAVYQVVLDHTDPNKISSLVSQLKMPPEGVVVDPSSEENDDAFFAAMGAAMPQSVI